MRQAQAVEHVTVYRRPLRFGGWPANYGMWRWDREIVIVFTEGAFKNDTGSHKRDTSKPFTILQGRSLDDGRTWRIEPFVGPTPGNRAINADEHMIPELRIGNPYTGENPPVPLQGKLDFTDPETVVMVGRTTCESLPNEVHSWFHLSRDRCRSWEGPCRFAGLDEPRHQTGRTDIVALSPDRALFFLSCHKTDGREGRVFCAETADGGRTFRFKSWIAEEPKDGYEIMPSTLRLGDGRLLCATRLGVGRTGAVNLYESADSGATWKPLPQAVVGTGIHSNPPCMVALRDGRLCLVYGFRDAPSGIRGRLSADGGRTWGEEIVLRADGGDFDIGYPRAVVNSEGKVVTGYYFNTHTDTERFIGASIWDAEQEGC
jgi:hypothetical protein